MIGYSGMAGVYWGVYWGVFFSCTSAKISGSSWYINKKWVVHTMGTQNWPRVWISERTDRRKWSAGRSDVGTGANRRGSNRRSSLSSKSPSLALISNGIHSNADPVRSFIDTGAAFCCRSAGKILRCSSRRSSISCRWTRSRIGLPRGSRIGSPIVAG